MRTIAGAQLGKMTDPFKALELPQLITPEWIAAAQAALLKSTWKGANALKEMLPKQVMISILDRTERLVQKEAALVEVREHKECCSMRTKVLLIFSYLYILTPWNGVLNYQSFEFL